MEAFKEQFAHGYRDPITKKLVMEPGQSAIIVAILSLGTFIGALMGAPAADKFGRRLSLILSVLVFCFGVIFQVLASDVPTLLVGR